MIDMTVTRRSSDGSAATYRVTLRERTDRTIHDVRLSHGESRRLGRPFASPEDLVGHVFEWLLARRAKEDIPSGFALEDLLAHEPDLVSDLDRRGTNADGILRDLTEATSAP